MSREKSFDSLVTARNQSIEKVMVMSVYKYSNKIK